MGPEAIPDRYTVTDRIGAGGGGTVWRADDEALGRPVAIKEIPLPAHLSDADRDRVRSRTLREARSAARLEHPSVISIYDVVEDDEVLLIVMEHVDAPSLTALLRDGALPIDRVARIGLDVLGGLAAAHDAGVVHRDVKPSNVLVPDDGPAVVTDFGVAAVLGETGLTRTGEALGTPDYIAPEQLEDDDVGPPCDLWALGATLYHAVEGVPPFQRGRTMATIHAVASADPRPLERAGPLAPVVQALLAKDPADRPDAQGTRAQLEEALHAVSGDHVDQATQSLAVPAGDPDDAHPADDSPPAPASPDDPAGPTADRSHERRRAALVFGGLLVVGVVAGLGIANSTGDDGTAPEPQPSVAAPTPAQDSPTDEDTTTPSEPATDTSPTETGSPNADATPSEPAAPSPTTTDDPADGGEQVAALPEGWRSFDGGAYTVGVPGGWDQRDGPASAVDLVAPDDEVYLRAADTDDPAPDVLADTQRIRDSFRSRYGDYEELALEPVEYRGYDAVRWEYTYSPGGQQLRAVHLNFSTGERGYSLNYQAPADEWDQIGGRFDEFTSTFRAG